MIKNSFKKILLGVACLLSTLTTFGQVSITTSAGATENFNSFTGTSTPTNWTITGTGTRGTTWNGTAQSTGTQGGWYGNTNMSFLGSSTASNAQATWRLTNNTGFTIQGFTLSFQARLWRSGTASPQVTVSWSNSSSSTVPAAGALANNLSSLSFNDVTTNISTGTTLSQVVNSVTIPNGHTIFIRFAHPGGSNSDNLGWDAVQFTPVLVPTITVSGTLTTLSTTYGTASSSTSFNLSGSNLTQGISVNPPSGLEVSASTSFTTVGTNGSPIVVGSTGTLASTPIYVRIASTTIPGTYNTQSIQLTSSGATTQTISTTSTGNTVAQKTLTISNPSAQSKTYDGTTTTTITGTLSGIVGTDVVTLNGTGNFSTANAGTNISVTSTSTLTGTHASRYTLTQPIGLTATINKATQQFQYFVIPFKSVGDANFTPHYKLTSNLTVTFTSSDETVAKIVGGQIQILTEGICDITATQSNDQNYLSVSQTKTLYVLPTVTGWTFESGTINNTPGNSPSNSSSSNGADRGQLATGTSFSGYHANTSSWSNVVGNGSSTAISVNNWSVNDYFQFVVSTYSFSNLRLTFDQFSSTTGPKNFKLQWSINGTTFQDVATYTPSGTSWSSTTVSPEAILQFDLTSIVEIQDQNTVYFRLTNTSTQSMNGGTISNGGTSRVDNFTLFGEVIVPLPINFLSFNGRVKGNNNLLTWVTTTDEEVKYYSVQRYTKVNDKYEFVEISKVQPNIMNSYEFIDNPITQTSYYKIVGVEMTGKSFESKLISVNNGSLPNLYEINSYWDMNGNPVSNPQETNRIIIQRNQLETKKIIRL